MTTTPLTTQAEPTAVDPVNDAQRLQARVSTVTRGAARAAVLGVNDGLVTNVCLILAVAGASSGADQVRIAGLASLIAGAFSMAAGEWISVKSQVELFDGIVGELNQLARRNPRMLLDELASKLEDSGLASDTAQRVATELPLDEDRLSTSPLAPCLDSIPPKSDHRLSPRCLRSASSPQAPSCRSLHGSS